MDGLQSKFQAGQYLFHLCQPDVWFFGKSFLHWDDVPPNSQLMIINVLDVSTLSRGTILFQKQIFLRLSGSSPIFFNNFPRKGSVHLVQGSEAQASFLLWLANTSPFHQMILPLLVSLPCQIKSLCSFSKLDRNYWAHLQHWDDYIFFSMTIDNRC